MLTRSQARPPRRRRGTATVEFAVIAPVLVTLMLGLLEVTRAVQVKNLLSDAARSGCRLAVENGKTTQNVQDNVNAVMTANGFSASDVTTTVLVNGNNVNANTAKKYDQVTVRVSIPMSKVSWIALTFFSTTSVASDNMVMIHY